MDGSLPQLMIKDVKSKLCDLHFQHKLDGPSTWHLIQFACGTVWNCQTMKFQWGAPDLFISQNTLYDYPTEAIATIEDKLKLKGTQAAVLYTAPVDVGWVDEFEIKLYTMECIILPILLIMYSDYAFESKALT